MSLVVAIIHIPCHIAECVATAIFVAPTLIAATSGELPFSLGGETEVFAGEGIQFCNKCFAIVPRNFLYRQICACKIAGVATHHRLPQFLGNLRFTNVVGRQGHLMCRLFITKHTGLLCGGAHGKGAAFHLYHLEAHAVHRERWFGGQT